MGCPNSIAIASDCNQSPIGYFTANCYRDCSEELTYTGALRGDAIYSVPRNTLKHSVLTSKISYTCYVVVLEIGRFATIHEHQAQRQS